MPAHSPEELYVLFREAFERGMDGLDDMVGLYEPGAQFVPAPGQAVSGTEAIRRHPDGQIDDHRRSEKSPVHRRRGALVPQVGQEVHRRRW